MNKNIALIGGGVLLLVIGGFIVLSVKNVTPPASDVTPSSVTPPGAPTVDSTQTRTTVTTNTTTITRPQAGTPSVTTNAGGAPTNTTVVVTGTVNPNGAFTTYWYEYGKSADLGNKTQSKSQAIGSGYMSIPSPGYITGLTKDTTYYFRLVAENSYGRVTGAQFSFQTSENSPPPVGSAPTTKSVAANSVANTTADLSGEVTPNSAPTDYWFEFGESKDLGNTTAIKSAGAGTAKVSVTALLSDLKPATTYYFRLNAQNLFGTVSGTILTFKTTGPGVVTAPKATTGSATNISAFGVTFRGTVSPNGEDATYWFEYSTDPLMGDALLHVTDQKTAVLGTNTLSVQADISGLNSRTTYYFRLVAQNSLGVGRGERTTFKTK